MKRNITCDILEVELPDLAEDLSAQLIDLIAELIARDFLKDDNGDSA